MSPALRTSPPARGVARSWRGRRRGGPRLALLHACLATAAALTLAVRSSVAQPPTAPRTATIRDVPTSEALALVRAAREDVFVFFTSDDPGCGYCAQANAIAPARIASAAATALRGGALPWRTLRVVWSPWGAFPTALGDFSLAERVRGIPTFVMFRNGRELWRVTGWTAARTPDALETTLRRHADAEAEAAVAAAPDRPRTTIPTSPPAPGPSPRVIAGVAPASLALSPAESTVLIGTAAGLRVEGMDARGTRVSPLPAIEFASSDPEVAQVDASGRVTARRRGRVTITARAGRVEARAAVRVEGFAQIASLSGGGATCAVPDARDRIYCWGRGLALPVSDNRLAYAQPTRIALGDVPAGTRIAQVALAPLYGCLLTDAGSVHCFGRDRYLGTGAPAPTQGVPPAAIARGDMPPGVRATRLAVGEGGACVAGSDTKLYCWGQREGLPLGRRTGPGGASVVPTVTERGEVPAGVAIDAVSVTINDGCALAGGAAYCWNGAEGTPRRLAGGAIPQATRMVGVGADPNLVGALGDDGRVYLRGAGVGARLGQGTNAFVPMGAPVLVVQGAVPPGTALTRLTMGRIAGAMCALGDDGAAYCWGANHQGASGSGALDDRPVVAPARVAQGAVPAGVRFVDLACGDYHCAALGDDGALYAWGSDQGGSLGQGERRGASTVPVRVAPPAER